ncbi:helix-turn-helix transcriptional regulator [Methanolobus chelungpuianus]|uniref:Transcriptional regulator n=1 Tax=Methanolobus chelungpuianus TaxID=502115 RepID=A0AAE3KYI1_9EURY|nr:winged helix-turn-helix domain-containing protein [Methanolobus chelungpuianus]MCQ6963034.1 transcriptional regulator [Methanolobus chelungpuianus]
MKKPLIEVIFASEKRKDVLLLLQDGSREMEYLLNSLDTTRTALLPQMKILEEHQLVSHDRDTYELTPIGKLIVNRMSPLLRTVDALGADIDYWGSHILDFIPSHLLERIGEIGKCNTIIPTVPETHYILRKFHESSKDSGILYSINTFFHPNFVELFADLLQNDVEIHFILSQDLLTDMTDNYNKIFNSLIDTNKFHFYLHPKDLGFMSLGVSKHYLMLTSLRTDGFFDNSRILCNSRTAVEWGIELFNHYLKDSTRINEV